MIIILLILLFSMTQSLQLILYKSSWCKRCSIIESHWNKLKIKHPKVTFKEINCDESECLDIRGYPTIILYKNNISIPYIGTLNNISNFIDNYY